MVILFLGLLHNGIVDSGYIYTVTGLTILVEYYIHLFVGFPNLEHLVNYMIAEVVAQGLVGGLLLVCSRWVLHLN